MRNKIAIIEPVGGHGGMNYYDFSLARGLTTDARCEVVLYTSDKTIVTHDLPFKVVKSFKGIWGKSPKALRAVKFVFGLIFSLFDAKKDNVKIVHYHFFQYTSLEVLCMKFAHALGFKIVVTAHDVESFACGSNSNKAQRIFAMANRVIAHNEVSKQELISKVSLSPLLICVVPHGNYLDSITRLPSKEKARKQIGLKPDDKVILFFGQIKKVKGLDILLHSLPRVIKAHPKLKLVIAGKVWKDNFLKYDQIINKNGLQANLISHIHYINDEDVANYYCAADLVVLPYRKIYQSGVLLMAMSYMIPVLASDILGMTEIIRHGENGFLFESENVSNLSSEIIEIFSNAEMLTKIGTSGYDTVVNHHDWDQIGQMTSNLYIALIDE